MIDQRNKSLFSNLKTKLVSIVCNIADSGYSKEAFEICASNDISEEIANRVINYPEQRRRLKHDVQIQDKQLDKQINQFHDWNISVVNGKNCMYMNGCWFPVVEVDLNLEEKK